MFPGASFHPCPRREWSRLTGSVSDRVLGGSGRRKGDSHAGSAARSGTGRDLEDALRRRLDGTARRSRRRQPGAVADRAAWPSRARRLLAQPDRSGHPPHRGRGALAALARPQAPGALGLLPDPAVAAHRGHREPRGAVAVEAGRAGEAGRVGVVQPLPEQCVRAGGARIRSTSR